MSVPSRSEIREKIIAEIASAIATSMPENSISVFDLPYIADAALTAFEAMGYIIKKDVPTNSNDEGT